MEISELLLDAFNRIDEEVRDVLHGLDEQALNTGPDGANSIGWLVWHLSRVQDDHLSEVAGREQIWLGSGYQARARLPLPETDTGYGHTEAQVAGVRFDGPDLLSEYHAAVHRMTADYLSALQGADLDRIVDTRWNPPVTLGARLVSVFSDCSQHVGQAAYAKGQLGR
ncbi:mycothiol transferase [Arthrobacter russicus]|uniref:Damage-inducible protein DinB n=1 Tax=Arthrobacter russicus TaxID=172040 RepID=A0ABU1JEH2_9MICC|nr:DUF664 domain-containing protein [Arthrobacter russicus]MDR6269811.1 putative damage-inducible protein DinB [Arthrobacter russicus]